MGNPFCLTRRWNYCILGIITIVCLSVGTYYGCHKCPFPTIWVLLQAVGSSTGLLSVLLSFIILYGAYRKAISIAQDRLYYESENAIKVLEGACKGYEAQVQQLMDFRAGDSLLMEQLHTQVTALQECFDTREKEYKNTIDLLKRQLFAQGKEKQALRKLNSELQERVAKLEKCLPESCAESEKKEGDKR